MTDNGCSVRRSFQRITSLSMFEIFDASENSDSYHTGSGYKIQDLLPVNRITVQYEVLRCCRVRFGSKAAMLSQCDLCPVFP
jgi:hypothetical protein